jgi:hypothetical protein
MTSYVKSGDKYVAKEAEGLDVVVVENGATGPEEIPLDRRLILTVEGAEVVERLKERCEVLDVLDFGGEVFVVIAPGPQSVKAAFSTPGVKRVDVESVYKLYEAGR